MTAKSFDAEALSESPRVPVLIKPIRFPYLIGKVYECDQYCELKSRKNRKVFAIFLVPFSLIGLDQKT